MSAMLLKEVDKLVPQEANVKKFCVGHSLGGHVISKEKRDRGFPHLIYFNTLHRSAPSWASPTASPSCPREQTPSTLTSSARARCPPPWTGSWLWTRRGPSSTGTRTMPPTLPSEQGSGAGMPRWIFIMMFRIQITDAMQRQDSNRTKTVFFPLPLF